MHIRQDAVVQVSRFVTLHFSGICLVIVHHRKAIHRVKLTVEVSSTQKHVDLLKNENLSQSSSHRRKPLSPKNLVRKESHRREMSGSKERSAVITYCRT